MMSGDVLTNKDTSIKPRINLTKEFDNKSIYIKTKQTVHIHKTPVADIHMIYN